MEDAVAVVKDVVKINLAEKVNIVKKLTNNSPQITVYFIKDIPLTSFFTNH